MAAVTIHSDFGDQEEEICHYFQLSPSICHAVMGLDHGKGSEFQKNIYFCFIDYAKAFDCMDQSKLWKILIIEMRIPDHLTCLLRNLYAGQETTVSTGHQLELNNRLVPNRKRSTSRLYIVTLLI